MCVNIKMAVPGDMIMERNKAENIKTCGDLHREVGRKAVEVQYSVVPVVVRTFGTIPKPRTTSFYMALFNTGL